MGELGCASTARDGHERASTARDDACAGTAVVEPKQPIPRLRRGCGRRDQPGVPGRIAPVAQPGSHGDRSILRREETRDAGVERNAVPGSVVYPGARGAGCLRCVLARVENGAWLRISRNAPGVGEVSSRGWARSCDGGGVRGWTPEWALAIRFVGDRRSGTGAPFSAQRFNEGERLIP